MAKLTSLRLAGWKSIRDAEIELRPLNVLIGANGAGKSNLFSFFELMRWAVDGRLQDQVARLGGAESLCHYGSKRTPRIEAQCRFAVGEDTPIYTIQFVPTPGDTLHLVQERWGPLDGVPGRSMRVELPFQDPNQKLPWTTPASVARDEVRGCRDFFANSRAYQFHDTSLLAPIRRGCPINDNRRLYSDAANLPAMLYLYHERYRTTYNQIVAAVRAIAPYFDKFVLGPDRLNPNIINLNWRARGTDYEFRPYQFSDGTLRAVALFTLLLQPEEDYPGVLLLDEPELGLHPAAVSILADLIKLAAKETQLLVATQSATLIDYFEPEDIVTVNLRDGGTVFERLDPKRLEHWLDEYTLSELWEQNVVQGGPY